MVGNEYATQVTSSGKLPAPFPDGFSSGNFSRKFPLFCQCLVFQFDHFGAMLEHMERSAGGSIPGGNNKLATFHLGGLRSAKKAHEHRFRDLPNRGGSPPPPFRPN
jgi:hypothetical protein